MEQDQAEGSAGGSQESPEDRSAEDLLGAARGIAVPCIYSLISWVRGHVSIIGLNYRQLIYLGEKLLKISLNSRRYLSPDKVTKRTGEKVSPFPG